MVPSGGCNLTSVLYMVPVGQAVGPYLIPFAPVVVQRKAASYQAREAYHDYIQRAEDTALEGMPEFVG